MTAKSAAQNAIDALDTLRDAVERCARHIVQSAESAMAAAKQEADENKQDAERQTMNPDSAKEVSERLERIGRLLTPVVVHKDRVTARISTPGYKAPDQWAVYADKPGCFSMSRDRESHLVYAESPSLDVALRDAERQALTIARETVAKADDRKRELEALIREVADGR